MIMEYILPEASSSAADVDFLIELIFWIVGAWFIAAEAVLFYFIFKYRQKDGVKAQYITGETHEQMRWIHIPHNAILLFDVIIIVFAIRVWYGVKQYQPPADETVRIIGQQWSWIFVHPGLDKILDTADDVTTVDDFHLKVDTTYRFQLTSKDVLHSLSIPAFRLKQDAIPGRFITGWFKPTRIGKYDFQCAEICGIAHGIMQSTLYVESEADHIKWLNSQAKKVAAKPVVPVVKAKAPVTPVATAPATPVVAAPAAPAAVTTTPSAATTPVVTTPAPAAVTPTHAAPN